MKKIIFILLILFCGYHSAQAQFISKGKIEFERKTNAWAELEGTFAEEIKKAMPQYKTDYFNYQFNNNQSIYKPGRESDGKPSPWWHMPAEDNEVFCDFTTEKSVAKKSVFEKTFLIEDSLRNAQWKITNDFREIAGFNCRRATAIIMDSVFVVAFYTDEITIPGGPESFNGLPGMILGLVINRLHTTWYATRVEVNSVDIKEITPPEKGKKITGAELKEVLKNSLSDWGDYAHRYIWAIMI